MKHTTVIIPARFESQRFPGKILHPIMGKPLILHVIDRIKDAEVSEIIIATDSEDIRQVVSSGSGCRIEMTRSTHTCGTDRIAEVATKINTDYILNIQGDELIIGPEMINDILAYINDDLRIGALYTDFRSSGKVTDKNIVKVLKNKMGNILYMSRSPIPFDRGNFTDPIHFYKQVGLYLFERETLLNFSRLEPSPLEIIEGIELLRALDYGIPLTGMYTDKPTCDVNIPEDVASAEKFVREFKLE